MPFIETGSKEIKDIVEKHKIDDVFLGESEKLEEKIMKIKYYNEKPKLKTGQVYRRENGDWLLLEVNDEFVILNDDMRTEVVEFLMLNLNSMKVDGSPSSFWKEEIDEGRMILVGELER